MCIYIYIYIYILRLMERGYNRIFYTTVFVRLPIRILYDVMHCINRQIF